MPELGLCGGRSAMSVPTAIRNLNHCWELSTRSFPVVAVQESVTARPNESEPDMRMLNAKLERSAASRTAALEAEVVARRDAEEKFRQVTELLPTHESWIGSPVLFENSRLDPNAYRLVGRDHSQHSRRNQKTLMLP